jgi:hypothetical protein
MLIQFFCEPLQARVKEVFPNIESDFVEVLVKSSLYSFKISYVLSNQNPYNAALAASTSALAITIYGVTRALFTRLGWVTKFLLPFIGMHQLSHCVGGVPMLLMTLTVSVAVSSMCKEPDVKMTLMATFIPYASRLPKTITPIVGFVVV